MHFYIIFLNMSKVISVSTCRFSWFFHQMEDVCVNFLSPVQFFWFLKGRCHGNQFCGKIVEKLTTPLNLSLCRSETEWDIATSMSVLTAQMLPPYCVKFREIRSSSSFELKWGRKWKLCCDSSEISRFSIIWHTGVLKRIRTSQFWFQQVNWQSFLYIWWKFGEIRISDPRVLAEKSCTVGVDNC